MGVSQRRACGAIGQPRSGQRRQPITPDDEVALGADIIERARPYGRYGYREVTVLPRKAGWLVNRKRVRRIGRREGFNLTGTFCSGLLDRIASGRTVGDG